MTAQLLTCISLMNWNRLEHSSSFLNKATWFCMSKISVFVTHNLIKEISPSDSRFLSFGPDMKGREKFRVDIVNIQLGHTPERGSSYRKGKGQRVL